MRKPLARGIIALFLCLVPAPGIRAQANGDEYARRVKLARSFMNEGRYDDALAALDKAFQAKPDDEALVLMGYVFLAEEKETEAMDVFDHVLSDGGTIPLAVQHMHGFAGSCRGTLYISTAKIRWESTNDKENFDVASNEIQNLATSELASSNGDGTVSTFVQFRANKKNWKFIYLLRGPTGKYQIGQNLWFLVVYTEPDLDVARKADGSLVQLIKSAPSIKGNPPSAPQASASTVPPAPSPSGADAGTPVPAAAPTELTEGQTPEQVQKLLGKPLDITTVKETVVYTYPTVKVYFEKGKLVNVEERKQQ
jgi:tetratricopeptide (TPR) repeat protein